MKRNLFNSAENLNTILKQADLSQIDSFEDIFIDLMDTNDTSSVVKLNNRMLIRNAYYVTVLLYGEEANLYLFKDLIDKPYNYRTQLNKLLKVELPENIIYEVNYIVDYFSVEYIKDVYSNCVHTRYIVNKMINQFNIFNNIYNLK